MAAAAPSEDAIITLTTVSSLTRPNAIRWLMANDNDANNAMNAWMDGGMADVPPPPQPRDTYSENDFHSARDGPQSQYEASFGISGSGALNPTVFNDNVIPPTRPSSRVDTVKPSEVFGPQNNPNLPQEETYEEQIQRATAMSLDQGQTLPGQETGVTYQNQNQNPHFRPATQEHYDQKYWAVVVPDAHTQEIILNPEAPNRRRQPGTPAFFKPSSLGRNLPALLKILHEIPMAREALMNQSLTLADYGREVEWWDGTPIKALRVVNVDGNGREQILDDIVFETQRLMAFLDDTGRAYGSTDALANLLATKLRRDLPQDAFLDVWKKATMLSAEDASLAEMFSYRGIRRDAGGSNPVHLGPFSTLSVRIDLEIANKGFSLYEAIDDIIWCGVGDTEELYLEHLGDVLVIDADNVTTSQGLGISIPPVWYADRYLQSSIQQTKEMRDRKQAILAERDEVNAADAQMVSYNRPGQGPALPVKVIVAKVSNYIQQTLDYKQSTAVNDMDDAGLSLDNIQTLQTQLGALLKSVTEKLEALDAIRNSVSQRVKEVSKLYTEDSDASDQPPKHKYTLRGVRTNLQTVYVLEKDRPDDENDMLLPSPEDWQWWKLEYITTSNTPVETSKVTESDVLLAASLDSQKALLVYASDKAISHSQSPLPTQLHNFVRADNLAFQSEIDNFRAQNAISTFETTPSPGKRKASSDSDLEVEFDCSPGRGGLDSTDSSPLDPHPLDLEDDEEDDLIMRQHDLPPPPRMRPLAPKPAVAQSSDEHIPISLQREMQASSSSSSGGVGMLTGMRDSYRIGDYVPELEMDDDYGGHGVDERGRILGADGKPERFNPGGA